MKVGEVEVRCRAVLDELARVIVGKDDVLRRLLAGILANGHILIEDYPGLAKTLIARLLSEAFDLGFLKFFPRYSHKILTFTPNVALSGATPVTPRMEQRRYRRVRSSRS